MKRLMPWLKVLLAVVVNLLIQLALAAPIGKYISSAGPDTPWYAWMMALLTYPAFVLQAVLLNRWVDKRPASALRLTFDRPARQMAAWGSLLSLALLLGFVALTGLAGITTWRWNSAALPTSAVLMTLLFFLAGPGEEFIWRGYIMNVLEPYGPMGQALLSSLLFTAIHTVTGRTSLLELLAIFLHGLFYAILTRRSGSIWPAVIIHGVYDALTVLIWSGNANYSLLAFGGELGVIKFAYKAAMVIPFSLMLWLVYRRQPDRSTGHAA